MKERQDKFFKVVRQQVAESLGLMCPLLNYCLVARCFESSIVIIMNMIVIMRISILIIVIIISVILTVAVQPWAVRRRR